MSYLPAQALTRTAEHDPARPTERSLRKNWWPVAYSSSLKNAAPLPVTLFGEPLVLFRGSDGAARCVQDLCPHRSVPLSLGTVVAGELVCRYHGWRFDGDGECRFPPELACKPKVKRRTYSVFDCGVLLWVYPDESEPLPFVNPLSAFAAKAGVRLDYYKPREMAFEHPWELWASSFVDGAHHEFAHPLTFSATQHGSLDFFFEPTTSPAAFAVRGQHDRMFGAFAYLTFCPTHEGSHRQFLSIFPISDVLPTAAKVGLFRTLQIAELLYDVVYEDYYIVEQQLTRIRQGAPPWGITGRYTTPVSRAYVEWFRKRTADEVWFKCFDANGVVLGKADDVRRTLPLSGVDSGREVYPKSLRQLFRRPALGAPPTWSSLSWHQRLVKRIAQLLPSDARGSAVRTEGGAPDPESGVGKVERPVPPADPLVREREIRAFIRSWLEARFNRPLELKDDALTFGALGIDSVASLELAAALAKRFGLNVPDFAPQEHPTPAALAKFLAGLGSTVEPLARQKSEHPSEPLAETQGRMEVPSWSRVERSQ